MVLSPCQICHSWCIHFLCFCSACALAFPVKHGVQQLLTSKVRKKLLQHVTRQEQNQLLQVWLLTVCEPSCCRVTRYAKPLCCNSLHCIEQFKFQLVPGQLAHVACLLVISTLER